MPVSKPLYALYTFLLLCFTLQSSKAGTVYWLGGTGNWSTGSKWSPSVPVAGDDVIIGNFTAASQVTVDVTPPNLKSLTFATASTNINLIINSGITLTTTTNITQQHSANNTSVTTNISGLGAINCMGSFLVGDNTAPSSLGTLTIVTTGNTNMTNLTTVNVNLPTFTVGLNLTLNTTSISGTLSTAIVFGTSVAAANANNPILNFNNGAMSVGGTINMTNSAYVNVAGFSGSGVPYAATKNYSQFNVNPSTNVTAGTTEILTLTGATPLNINPDGNAAGTLDFNGAGSGTSTIVYGYTGASAQSAYASTTGLDATPGTYQNISFSGSGTKTFLAGSMTVTGDWVSTGGAIDLSTNGASVTFTKATPLMTNTGSGVTFGNITLSNSSPTLSATGKFSVGSSGILTLSGTSVLTTNGNLTLLSTANGSAGVATIPAGCSVSGNVNVQRYIQGNNDINYRGYRLLSSPVNTSGLTSIDYIANSTIVTGATTGTGTVGGNPTIYLYNESLPVNNTSFVSGNFVGVTNTTTTTLSTLSGSTTSTTTLPTGNGYFVYFRGDNVHTTNKTTTPFASPENVTFTATGALNQGSIIVKDWFTASGLSYTSTQAAIAKGFNLVGNPYASSIDWDKVGTGITTSGLDNTIYIYNANKKAYAAYLSGSGGLPGTNWPNAATHNANIIPSGQGFFVHATSASPTLTFTETAKSSSQQATSTNLILVASQPTLVADPSYLRLQLEKDTVNEEDVLLLFNTNASAKYVVNEDAVYLKGNNSVSLSLASADNMALAIDQLPLPQTSQSIGLNVKTTSAGTYQLNLTELKNIPDLFDIWLMDNYTKDSLDIKHNPTYSFVISADTNSSSLKRFTLVIRTNPLLAYRLLNFTGDKTTGGDQLKWVTENENSNTVFALQRSTDAGKNFSDLAIMASGGSGTYNYLDSNPASANWYRLKQTDQFGGVSYSTVIGIQYANLSNNAIGSRLSVYPNPTADVVNMSVTNSGNAVSGSFDIVITSSSGNVVKNVTSPQANWQGNVSSLMPGIYMMKVIDKNNNKVVGTSKFIKM